MVKFVIVEDNPIQRKQVKDIVIKLMMSNNLEYDIYEFETMNKKLLNLIDNSIRECIYILDYELINCDAVDIARKIREKDWISPIIINTVYNKYEYNTLKTRLQILDFIDKYNETDELMKVLKIALKIFGVKPDVFKYKIRGIDYNIDYNKILYIYRDTYARKLVIVTDNNKYSLNKNIRDMIKILDDRFKITHKACIVNTDRVEAFVWKDNKIIFDNGMSTDLLSSTHKKELENNVVV